MRLPIGETRTWEEFERDWYLAQFFNIPVMHEGVDFNLKTGGNSDLGQPLRAVANGKIVYYHYGTHPGSGFGRHFVLRFETSIGPRWAHYAHCDAADFPRAVRDVAEGELIGRLGNTGNSSAAHLHFAIWKVDPTFFGGIDRVARNTGELAALWEDPLSFLRSWMRSPGAPVITDETRIPQINDWTVRDIRMLLEDYAAKWAEIREIVNGGEG